MTEGCRGDRLTAYHPLPAGSLKARVSMGSVIRQCDSFHL